MAYYCEVSDVQAQLPEDLANSAAIVVNADGRIAGEQALLDARLGERYTVPFTEAANPVSWAWAKVVLAKVVTAKAYMAVRAIEGDEEAATWFPRALLAEAEAEIARAVAGELALSDAVEVTDSEERSAEDGYSDLTTTEQGYLDPWFTRQDEW